MTFELMEEAKEMQETLVHDRRALHQMAELGFDLPKTKAYVWDRLTQMGYEPREVGGGITAVAGKGGKTVLVRADMDALPQQEESGLPFASCTGAAHTCGHDIHTASLLGAAFLLKKHEEELPGRVKLCFQPAEEIVKGAASMVAHGVLQDPPVDAALGFHVALPLPVGHCATIEGYAQASSDLFRITVTGKGCHGSAPEKGRDPISAAAFILLGLESAIAREVSAQQSAVLTIGKFLAGEAANILPDRAVMEGTLRTYEKEVRAHLKSRLASITSFLAEGLGCQASVEFLSETPACYNDPAMTRQVRFALEELLGKDCVSQKDLPEMGSDDFACYQEKVPGCYINVGFGDGVGSDGMQRGIHSPYVLFEEEGLPIMAGLMAALPYRWINEQK